MQFTPQTIPSLFFHACDQFASKTAFMTKEDGQWTNISYAQAEDRVIHIAKCLLHIGMERQDHIAIFATNCPEWVLLDLAVQSIGGVTVPVYPTLNPNQVQFIVDHANVKMIFGNNPEKLSQINHPHKVCLGEDAFGSTNWKDFLKTPHTIGNKDFFLTMKDAHPDELASIVYTSGTTGQPKGVMLSQRNIASNVQASLEAIPIDQKDSSVSFLPLSHMFERTAGCYCILAKGATMAFCPDISNVGDYIKEVRPTVLVTVPRLLEKIYQKVWDNMATQSRLIQKLFHFAIYRLHRKNPLYFLFQKLFFQKIRMQMGGNLRFIVSGGAALSDQIYAFFDQCGFCILQGYGLTETSPVAAVNPPSKRKVGTVGLPLQGVEVKISEEEEVLIKGPNIMQGYYKNPEETKRVMTLDGFFKTGDIGTIDDEGYLSITDRIKDLIVTSGGKKIAPLPIENQLVASTWIDQACLVGEGQKTIGALIVPNFEAFSSNDGQDPLTQNDMDHLADSPEVQDKIQEILDRINANLAQYQKIKYFKVLSRPFLMENEEITPTLKLRRKVIYDNYASEIQTLFKN